MSLITLENMEFYAYHGCFAEEQIIGTRFLVDLFLETDTSEAEDSDDLSKTVNYQEIYLLVKKEMEHKSRLLENVAHRIIEQIALDYPQVKSIKVKVSKMNPPLGGKIERVSVEMGM